jgi:cyclopropane-fatty-acyl-phospholipid synthase
VSGLFFRALEGLRRGSLEIRLPGGGIRRFEGPEEGPRVEIEVRDPRFFQRMLFDGEIGAGESYIRGEWRASSLADAVSLGILNRGHLRRGNPLFWMGAIGGWARHQLRRNTRRGSRRNIFDHYDLGNDFFALFLDDTMTYSSAVYERDDLSLEEAQRAKYRRIARKAGIEPGHHVLEIGCGWGGFAEYAAAELGCRVTGLTISRAQADFARRRMARAGLEDRVSIEVRDYREDHGTFDRIVSIEMLEAVGHAYLPAYFRAIDRSLARGGRAVVQVITIPDERYLRYRLRPDYIQRFIFPGAHLPSLGAMSRAMRRGTALAIDGMEDIAASYAITLERWRERLLARVADVRAMGFDDGFVRRFEYYFAYCEAAFRTRHIADWQLELCRVEGGAR